MTRAERRRQEREQKKQQKQGIQKADALSPIAVLNFAAMSTQEVEERTGTQAETLRAWEDWKTGEIKKRLMIEMQQKMDQFQEYSTVCNMIITMKALDGFRYGKAAAQWIQKHYSDCTWAAEQTKIRDTYQELHERWDIDLEFDEPDINKLMGLDVVDWRREYVGMKIPHQVFSLIWDDSGNIERAQMEMAVLWEICEEFCLNKQKDTMLHKFMNGVEKKYDEIWEKPQGISWALDMINEKYNLNMDFSEKIKKTLAAFGL